MSSQEDVPSTRPAPPSLLKKKRSPDSLRDVNHVGFKISGPTVTSRGSRDSLLSEDDGDIRTSDPNDLNVGELLSRISELEGRLEQYTVDLSAERVRRKTKDKSLMKLAKQLNIVQSDLTARKQDENSLAHEILSLKERNASLRRDYDLLNERHVSNAAKLHNEVVSLQGKLRAMRRTSDNRAADIASRHGDECDVMRREMLRLGLESDRLRVRLAAEAMLKDPDGSENIAKEVMRGADEIHTQTSAGAAKSEGRGGWIRHIALAVLAAGVAAGTLSSSRGGALLVPIGDYLCGPARPGTIFGPSGVQQAHESPWWSPPSTAEWAFASVCPGRVRTRIAWRDGALTVSGADGRKAVLVSYKGRSIVVKSDRILTEKQADVWTSKKAPWAVD